MEIFKACHPYPLYTHRIYTEIHRTQTQYIQKKKKKKKRKKKEKRRKLPFRLNIHILHATSIPRTRTPESQFSTDCLRLRSSVWQRKKLRKPQSTVVNGGSRARFQQGAREKAEIITR